MPKKKQKDEVIGLYDLTNMTDEELRQYIEELKKEADRMKIAFSQQQRDKREFVIQLDNTQVEISKKNESIIEKGMDFQQLIEDCRKSLTEENALQLVAATDFEEAIAKNILDNFFHKTIQLMAYKEGMEQHDELRDKIMQLDLTKLSHRFTADDFKGKLQGEWIGLLNKVMSNLETVNNDYVGQYFRMKQDHIDERFSMLNQVLNDKSSRENVLAHKNEQMAHYFSEMFLKNTKIMEDLKVRVSELDKELWMVKMHLKRAVDAHKNQDHIQMSKTEVKKESFCKLSSSKRLDNQVDAEVLNYALEEKLRQATKERDVLKKQFVSAMRKVQRKSYEAIFIAEKMLSAILQYPVK